MRVIEPLLSWYERHGRHDLPWRQTRDPYNVLVSEFMLQQTQVSRVIPKYRAFLEKFPTIPALAAADRSEVLQAWQGLGYNSRAVRLHALAKLVGERGLPSTEDELKALPGVGPYTAGAIMIFSHDRVAASVDVNVARVLRRLLFAREQTPTPKEVEGMALSLLRQSGRPHDWHSALMDFGSRVCTAKAPACATCPLSLSCRSKGPRDDERVKKQSTFRGSNRWWRGQILKHLLREPMRENELFGKLDGDDRTAFDEALRGLLSEDIVRRGEKLHVAD